MKSYAYVVVIALIVVYTVASIVTPILIAGQQRRAKDRDRRREDKVAARAEEVAQKVAEAAELLIESNRIIAQTAEDTRVEVARAAAATSGRLEQIHTLVNSNLTAAMRAQLDAEVRGLALLRELISIKRSSGSEASPELLADEQAAQERVEGLRVDLADREAQSQRADFELRQAGSAEPDTTDPPIEYRRVDDAP